MSSKRLSVEQRKEIFHQVVTTQDTHLMSITDSYRHVAEQFNIPEAMVRQIADEGVDKDWPPLSEEN